MEAPMAAPMETPHSNTREPVPLRLLLPSAVDHLQVDHVQIISEPTIALGRSVLDAVGIVITLIGFFLALLWI